MPRPVTRPQIWTALRDAGLVPADLTPTRDIGRWVDGDLWHAVGVRKVGDQLDWGCGSESRRFCSPWTSTAEWVSTSE
jgi:hypothetical protein